MESNIECFIIGPLHYSKCHCLWSDILSAVLWRSLPAVPYFSARTTMTSPISYLVQGHLCCLSHPSLSPDILGSVTTTDTRTESTPVYMGVCHHWTMSMAYKSNPANHYNWYTCYWSRRWLTVPVSSDLSQMFFFSYSGPKRTRIRLSFCCFCLDVSDCSVSLVYKYKVYKYRIQRMMRVVIVQEHSTAL